MKPEHLYYKEVNARDGDYYRDGHLLMANVLQN
jgi:hypothetical protein